MDWKSTFRPQKCPKSTFDPQKIIKWVMLKKVFSSRLEPSTPRNRQKPVFDFARATSLRKLQNQAMVLKKKFFLIFSCIECVQVKCSSTSRNVRIVITNFDQNQESKINVLAISPRDSRVEDWNYFFWLFQIILTPIRVLDSGFSKISAKSSFYWSRLEWTGNRFSDPKNAQNRLLTPKKS